MISWLNPKDCRAIAISQDKLSICLMMGPVKDIPIERETAKRSVLGGQGDEEIGVIENKAPLTLTHNV